MGNRAANSGSFRDAEFFAALLAGDAVAAREALGDVETLSDPRLGDLPVADLPAMADDAKRYWGGLRGTYVNLRFLDHPRRKVAEGLLAGALKDRVFSIPVCTVADASTRMLRIYYTLWPLTGTHRVRAPTWKIDEKTELNDVVAAYQRALAKGDVEAILHCFEPEACAREPSGVPYVHCGPAALRKLYSAMFANGGIALHHATVTDDGRACAIEYTTTRWGAKELPAQAGVAVYERGATGKLRAARIYDDVDPP